jgi:hypothetical protein
MKNKIILSLIVFAISLFTIACNGDHSTNTGDTGNTFHDAPSVKDAPSSIDTTKPTTTSGDASNVDNSGSGGQKITKDTSVKKSSGIKK